MNKKDLILEEAARLFLDKGYNDTSLSEIIENTNTSKGCLFHHYENKAALGMAVQNKILSNLDQILSAEFSNESFLFYFIAQQRLIFKLFFENIRFRKFTVEVLKNGTLSPFETSPILNVILMKKINLMPPSRVILSKCASEVLFKAFLPEISYHLNELSFEDVYLYFITSFLNIWYYEEQEYMEEIELVNRMTANYSFVLDITTIRLRKS